MRLPRPFFRLPLQVDVTRLRQELSQFGEGEWRRHPTGYAGNSAIQLISVDGGETDAFAGPMQPTPALMRSPYMRQVLTRFGVVWSRSRLMRLESGASVPEHCDLNYHWFHRVRVHIPVQTDPAVQFRCDGQTVHMAAGEVWIFDNWRQHSVHNGSTRDRIHFVADTCGNAAFWAMVRSSQGESFDRWLGAPPQVIEYRPEFDARPFCEHFNVGAVMYPAEVEQLTNDLLADLSPPRNGEVQQVQMQFVQLATGFCREWRALWSLYADTRDGWPGFAELRSLAMDELHKLPDVLACASNGMSVSEVWHSRMLLHSFRGDGRMAAEPDRTLGPASAAVIAGAGSRTVPVTTFRAPVFIVAAPRSGSSALFEALARARDLASAGGETHWLVETLPRLQPLVVGSNRLTKDHADEEAEKHVRELLMQRLHYRDGRAAEGDAVRFVEKTPKHALRIPFFNEIFPDARFVFLWRDARENISSIIEAWRAGRWITYPQLPGRQGPWSLLLPPGWQDLRDASLEEIAAYQWRATNQIILDDLSALPRDRWVGIRYSEFVADPVREVERLCRFAGIDFDESLRSHLAGPLPPSAHTLTPPAAGKWKANAALIERVLPSVLDVETRLAALQPFH